MRDNSNDLVLDLVETLEKNLKASTGSGTIMSTSTNPPLFAAPCRQHNVLFF